MASEKTLAAYTRKELAQIAKHNKVDGWHAMKKADLIDALKNRRLAKIPPEKSHTERSRALRRADETPSRVTLRRTSKASSDQKPATPRPLRLKANAAGGQSERIAARPLGSNWIYAHWLLTSRILDRAEASLGSHWHRAVPVLRMFDITACDETSPTKRSVATIPIGSAVDHWYVPVADPSRTYELQVGYETAKGQFFLLARSTPVKLPLPGTPLARKYDEQRHEIAPQGWAGDPGHRFPIRGSAAFRFADAVSLEVEADVMITGQVSPDAVLSCQESEVPVEADGTFEIRLPLEEGRQVIPLEAVAADGSQSQTVILAIERNTKTLEPQPLNEWE